MKAVVAAFNQEKALVGAFFSVITNLRMDLRLNLYLLSADVRIIYPRLILIYMARIIVLRLISDFIVFIKRSLAEILVNIFQCANCALLGSPLPD